MTGRHLVVGGSKPPGPAQLPFQTAHTRLQLRQMFLYAYLYFELMKVELLTSPTCPHCPAAREILRRFCKEKGLRLVEISTATSKGQKWARKYGITGTPSFVIFGKVRPVLKTGVPSWEELEDMLALANGEKEPPKNFFEKMLRALGIRE